MPLNAENLLRRCRFRPYAKGCGPRFNLTVWDTNSTSLGKWVVGYRLTMIENSSRKTILFEGQDICVPPIKAIDDDATIAAIMGFLTLRPGDTDEEYFEGYNEIQREFCEQHAEALSAEVCNRFGE